MLRLYLLGNVSFILVILKVILVRGGAYAAIINVPSTLPFIEPCPLSLFVKLQSYYPCLKYKANFQEKRKIAGI